MSGYLRASLQQQSQLYTRRSAGCKLCARVTTGSSALTTIRAIATSWVSGSQHGLSPDPTAIPAANRDVRLVDAVLALASPLLSEAGTLSRQEDVRCNGARAGRTAPRASSPGEGIGDGGLSTQHTAA